MDSPLYSLKGLRRTERLRKWQSGGPASLRGNETLWSTFSQGLLSLVSSFRTITASLAHHPLLHWLQWMADQSGGNRHSPSNPPFSCLRAQWGLLTARQSSRSLLFQCVLALVQVSCTTGPFSPPGARIDRKVLKRCTEAWVISKGRGVTVETCECV